jgi:hypothetical protein
MADDNNLSFEYDIEIPIKKNENPPEEILKKHLKILEKKWILKDFDKISQDNLLKRIFKNLNINSNENIDFDIVEMQYEEEMKKTLCLLKMFSVYQITEYEDDYQDPNLQRVKHLQNIILSSKDAIESLYRMKNKMDPNFEDSMNDDTTLFHHYYLKEDDDKLSPYQKLLLYLFQQISLHKYKRYRGKCYEPVYVNNQDEYYTYAWKESKTIEDFIYAKTKKNEHYEQWKWATSAKDIYNKACLYLTSCKDDEFPELEKDRHIFSFKNGVYVTFDKKNFKDNSTYKDYFYEYGTSHPLSQKNISCKFFNIDFPTDKYDNYMDIPTPNLDSIFDYQYNDHPQYIDILKWGYIMLGRMLYYVNELDQWQVMPFFKGKAGTGKGTICTKVIKEFYELDDVGILSNDGEKTFGLSGFYDKLVFIAPEIKGDISLSQATFQSMVSGEDVVVPIKHKRPIEIEWNVPGAMAGNQNPDYNDNSGSMARRMIIFEFAKIVSKQSKDPALGSKIKKEIPYILKKCNLAYLDAVSKFGKKDVWSVMPSYFTFTQEEMSKDLNPVQALLNSDQIIYGKDQYIFEKVFKEKLNMYCSTNNYPKQRYNKDLYDMPFAMMSEKLGYEIKIVTARKKYPKDSNKRRNGRYIVGFDFKVDDEDDDDEFGGL